MTHKHLALALLPIIGASVLLCAQNGQLSGRADLIFGTKQTTITRSCLRDGTNYMVNFIYDPLGGGSIPATIPPGQMHYPCSVSVWANGVQIGASFGGEVTESGCFEDKPEDAVAKALSQNITTTNQLTVRPFVTNSFDKLNFGGSVSNFRPIHFYYTNHEVYIADSRYGPTNIVISNDYSGTIQIGTNFATVKELDTWMSVLGSMKRFEKAWTTTNVNRLVTYTVDVADGLWTSTNVIEIKACSDFCTRMRYVENGLTNDFHAAFASFTVITNAP